MKNISQSEILDGLKLFPSQSNKYYAGKVSKLFSFINDIKKLAGFSISMLNIKGNVEMVANLPVLIKENFYSEFAYHDAVKQQENCKIIFGEFESWDTIHVQHLNGYYSFPFPIGNRFYNMLLELADIKPQIAVPDNKIISTISFDKAAFKVMATACKFISRDTLRPVMQHICLAFENNTLEVVSTDAHRLYISKKFESTQIERLEILISEKTAKEFSKIKDEADLHILESGEIMINNKIYSTLNERFVDYRCVMPDYKKSMLFDRVQFIDNCKQILPHANQTTKQITFHLNGSIAMHCEDIDFGMEAHADMRYISKDFKDTDIAFNGSFLTECLSVFKEDTIKMYTDGSASKCAIFTNESETILLMPLMINNNY